MIEGEVLKRYELSLDDILPQIMETIIEVYGERHRISNEVHQENRQGNSLRTGLSRPVVLREICEETSREKAEGTARIIPPNIPDRTISLKRQA